MSDRFSWSHGGLLSYRACLMVDCCLTDLVSWWIVVLQSLSYGGLLSYRSGLMVDCCLTDLVSWWIVVLQSLSYGGLLSYRSLLKSLVIVVFVKKESLTSSFSRIMKALGNKNSLDSDRQKTVLGILMKMQPPHTKC